MSLVPFAYQIVEYGILKIIVLSMYLDAWLFQDIQLHNKTLILKESFLINVEVEAITEMGLVSPNPKLCVPRSEVFMIVWENQIG